MQLNRREKLIAFAALALIALFLGDRLVVAPALEHRAALAAEAERQAELRELGERLYGGLDTLEQRWASLREAGLTESAADAEGNLLRAVRGWAEDAGASVTSLVPDRVEPDPRLPRVHVRVMATGSMPQVVGLLHRIETAELPVRVQEVQIGSRRDEGDELTVNLRLSTLYIAPAPPPDPRGRPTPAGRPRS